MLEAYPSSPLIGDMTIPGDKSISHRAVMLGSLCEGQVSVQNFLQSQDCLHTVEAMRQLGVNIQRDKDKLLIDGKGLSGLKPSPKPIDCGNSGTLMRLLTGLLAGQSFSSELVGDESLSVRPMDRIIEPLTQMGASIKGAQYKQHVVAPLSINPGQLAGITYEMPIASAQIKSSLLLASLYAQGQTIIHRDTGTRDHTETMLQAFGAPIAREGDSVHFSAHPLKAQPIIVPGDISSAAFFMVAATAIPGSHLKILNVGLNPTRLGVIHILQLMGADIKIHLREGYEPVGDIEVKAAQLTGIDIPTKWVVSAIDEFPILFIASCFAKGCTTLKHAAELRVKEVDRIEVMANNLQACGIKVETAADGMSVWGGRLGGGVVDSMGDHRIAMAFAIAGFCGSEMIKIKNYACIDTSFPSFIEIAKNGGLSLRENEV